MVIHPLHRARGFSEVERALKVMQLTDILCFEIYVGVSVEIFIDNALHLRYEANSDVQHE